MKFEVTVLPVAEVERAKAFYQGLGGAWTPTYPWARTAYMDARQRGSSQDEASAAAGRYMAEVKHIVV